MPFHFCRSPGYQGQLLWEVNLITRLEAMEDMKPGSPLDYLTPHDLPWVLLLAPAAPADIQHFH